MLVATARAGKESTKYTAADACPAGVRTKGGSSWTRNWLQFDNECAPLSQTCPISLLSVQLGHALALLACLCCLDSRRAGAYANNTI